MLNNGIIPCRIRPTATHRYIIRLEDVEIYLQKQRKSDKYDITKHPKYKYLSDANPKNAFDIGKYLKCRLKVKDDEAYETFEVSVS